METAYAHPPFSEDFTYDKNGNIKMLKRRGEGRGGVIVDIMMDDLTIFHTGNQMRSIHDAGYESRDAVSQFLSKDSNVEKQYVYNNNGSLTQDFNKGIACIKYNSLNLSQVVQFTNGNRTDYLYDATGMKRRVTHRTAKESVAVPMGSTLNFAVSQVEEETTTDYCGSVIYENKEVSKILTEQGYITLAGDMPTYHYFIKDHLGSTRVLVDQNGESIDHNSYYPSGTSIRTASTEKNPYKYNGKELDRKHGLDWYDYGARMYDPVVGVWNTVDPLAEKYYSVSPYTYCLNNPMRFVDLDGTDTYEYNTVTRELVWINDKGGNKIQYVDFIDGDDNSFAYTQVNGEEVFVYALKDNVYAVTNFDAKLNDRTYNTKTGYEYSFEDFCMRNILMKSENPIGKYILRTEREESAEPITRRDAENTYGSSLMGLIALTRAMDAALSLTDGAPSRTPSLRSYNKTTSLKPKANSNSSSATYTLGSKNSWNSFLKANKGKYKGAGWEKKAKEDYYKSEFYKKE